MVGEYSWSFGTLQKMSELAKYSEYDFSAMRELFACLYSNGTKNKDPYTGSYYFKGYPGPFSSLFLGIPPKLGSYRRRRIMIRSC